MSTAPPSWEITQEQAQQCVSYIQRYRRYALERQAPSFVRNTHVQVLQTIQGKLMRGMDQSYLLFVICLSGEERTALEQMTRELVILIKAEPVSQAQSRTLIDLARFKSSLART